MINEINKFFNENPVLTVILIVLLLFTIYYMMPNNENAEHMDVLPQCTINTDQQFYAQFAQSGRILNFKCNVKGIDYYLACVKMEDYATNNPDKKPDCTKSMLILIPVTEIQSMLNSYLQDMSLAKDICNAKAQVICKTKNANQECPISFEECNLPRFFLHDFNVVDVSPPNPDFTTTLRKYVIKGTAIPSLNGTSQQTMFNTFLINESGVNMVCGDTYAYGSPGLPKQYAEVIISEQMHGNTGGVVGADSGLKIKIRFNALQQLISTTSEGIVKRTPIVDTCTGEQKIRPVYLGVCNSSQTCSKNNNTYQRVCVYDDIQDPNVLEFQPFIVDSQ